MKRYGLSRFAGCFMKGELMTDWLLLLFRDLSFTDLAGRPDHHRLH